MEQVDTEEEGQRKGIGKVKEVGKGKQMRMGKVKIKRLAREEEEGMWSDVGDEEKSGDSVE